MRHISTVNNIIHQFNNGNNECILYTNKFVDVYKDCKWTKARSLQLNNGILYKKSFVIGRIIKLKNPDYKAVIHYKNCKELTYAYIHSNSNKIHHYYFDIDHVYNNWFSKNPTDKQILQYIFKCLIINVIKTHSVLQYCIYNKVFHNLKFYYYSYKTATDALNNFNNIYRNYVKELYNKAYNHTVWYVVPSKKGLQLMNTTHVFNGNTYLYHKLNNNEFTLLLQKLRYMVLKNYNINVGGYRAFINIYNDQFKYNQLTENIRHKSDVQKLKLFQEFSDPLATLA